MKTLAVCIASALCFSLSVLVAVADDLQPIESQMARQIAQRLVAEAAKFEKPQIKIDADTEQANGVHAPGKVGIMVVPQKDLKSGDELGLKFKGEKGGSLAYLFMYHILPVIDDKLVESNQLRSVKFTGDDGTEHTVYVLLLAVRQLPDGDFRLQAYGYDDKPLVQTKFAPAAASGPEPVGCDIRDPNEQTRRGKLVVTMFGKYQASFPCGHKED